MEHWLLISIVHIIRAELLAISANEHYFSLSDNYDRVLKALKDDALKALKDDVSKALKDDVSKALKDDVPKALKKDDSSYQKLLAIILEKPSVEIIKIIKPIAAASLKEINHAEDTLMKAERLLSKMAHQNSWVVCMEFGLAQVQIEKMLFEMELRFLAWQPLNVGEYIKESSRLESKILKAMQRIRNVLDTIPYQASKWDKVKEEYDNRDSKRSMVNIECNAFKLWRQLFVVGFFYAKLLSGLYQGLDAININETKATNILLKQDLIIRLFDDLDDKKYSEQWKLWCISMRFSNFTDDTNMETFSKNLSPKEDGLKSISFRARVIKAMLVESNHKEGIEIMWNLRRSKSTSPAPVDGSRKN
jgi:hypothetical protein